jgi:O-acetyl-ADP-ribose deacetylase (regulator of RNase III)
MEPMQYVIGDATSPTGSDAAIIAHVCNDLGQWGRGFVLAVSSRWSTPELAYRQWHRQRESNGFGLGAVQLVDVQPGIFVANMVAQHGLVAVDGIPPIRYEAVDTCLARLAVLARQHSASVHMPRIGCGLAGGSWDLIESIVERRLAREGIRSFVYDLPA